MKSFHKHKSSSSPLTGLISILVYISFSYILILRIRKCYYECNDKHILATNIAMTFTFMTLPISFYHTLDHISNFIKPKLQSQIVRILWMIPIFSIESLISIHWVQHSYYFQAIREIYETYAIYSFMRYLMYYLGDARLLSQRLATMPAYLGYHKPPFCCLSPWIMGEQFLRKCRTGVFQFVVVRFVLVVSGLILKTIGLYHEGQYSTHSLHLYFTLANGLSQAYALYSLFMFYHCTNKELKAIRPFTKFLCIKLVIFFSWWQGLAIFILVRCGHISSGHGHSANEVASLIQRLFVGMEMLVASVGYFHAFPVSEISGYSTDMLGFNFNSTIASPVRGTSIKGKLRLSRSPNSNSSKNICNDIDNNENANKNNTTENTTQLDEDITGSNTISDGSIKDMKQSNNHKKMKKFTSKENEQKLDFIAIAGNFMSYIFSHNEDSDKRSRGNVSRRKKEDDDSSEKSSTSYEIYVPLTHDINTTTLPHTNSDLESLSDVVNGESINISKNTELVSNQSIVYSQGKSFSRGKLHHQYVRVRKVSADADADDDCEEGDDSIMINSSNQSPTSVSSKDGTNNNDITMLLALWTASMPAELQEDISDLGSQMITDLSTLQSPYVTIKKLIKSRFNDSIS